MKPEEDAVGQAMIAYYKGENSFEIYERDDGYFDARCDVAVYFSTYEDWPPYVQKAIDLVKGRVLDIGCGAGRHSLHLQEKGHDVLGIDVSPLAIQVCKQRGLRKTENISIDEVNFPPNSFDTIIMMGNNFGLFGNLENARKLLKRFCTMTSEDALIIAETRDPSKTSNPDHLKYQEENRKKGRMPGQIRIRVRFKKFVTPWFDLLIVSKEEMKQILKGTGWIIQKFIDSGGSIYIAIIEKEKTA